jgi:hypothetical protein
MNIANSETVHGRIADICCKNIKFFSGNDKQMQYRMFKNHCAVANTTVVMQHGQYPEKLVMQQHN